MGERNGIFSSKGKKKRGEGPNRIMVSFTDKLSEEKGKERDSFRLMNPSFGGEINTRKERHVEGTFLRSKKGKRVHLRAAGKRGIRKRVPRRHERQTRKKRRGGRGQPRASFPPEKKRGAFPHRARKGHLLRGLVLRGEKRRGWGGKEGGVSFPSRPAPGRPQVEEKGPIARAPFEEWGTGLEKKKGAGLRAYLAHLLLWELRERNWSGLEGVYAWTC